MKKRKIVKVILAGIVLLSLCISTIPLNINGDMPNEVRADGTVTVSLDGWVYGSEPATPALTGTTADPTYTYYKEDNTTPTGTADGASTEGGQPTKAGTYNIHASYNDGTDHEVESSFTISKRPIEVTANIDDKLYNGLTDYNGSISTTGGSFVAGDDIAISYALANKNAGDAVPLTVTLSGADAANYDISGINLTEKVIPLDVEIRGTTVSSKQYDGNTNAVILDPGYVYCAYQIPDGDVVEVDPGIARFTDSEIGNNKIVTFTGFGLTGTDAANYRLTEQPGSTTASITKISDFTVTLDEDAYVYDAQPKTPSVTVKHGDNVISPGAYTVTYNNNIDAGTASVVVKGSTDEYDIEIEKTFSITKAPLTVTAEAKEKVYGKPDPALTYTVTGMKGNDNAESAVGGALSREEGEDVGTYTITQGTLAPTKNYSINYTSAIMEITKATKADVTADTVEVRTKAATGESINLSKYLEKGAAIVNSEVTGSLGTNITLGTLSGSNLNYDITANTAGTTGTIVLTISCTNYGNYKITIPVVSNEKTTTVMLVSNGVSTNITALNVNGLNAYTKDQTGNIVDVKFKATPIRDGDINSSIKASIDAIVDKAMEFVKDKNNIVKEHLNIVITRSINEAAPETITDLGRVVEIEIDYDMTGKYEPMVIREHGGNVVAFTKLSSRPVSNYTDGTWYTDGKKIYIYTRYFSVYTIAYSKEAKATVTPVPTKTTTTSTKSSSSSSGTKSSSGSSDSGNSSSTPTGSLTAPKTGDNSNIWRLYVLLIGGLALIGYAYVEATESKKDMA